MMNVRSWGLSVLAALSLAACGGGGGDGDQNPRASYSALVSFGDSLSDVGTYATPTLVAATGGGKYTVNAPDAKNWTELLAAQMRVAAPCPAQTGLNASGPLAGFAAVVADHPECTNYAQGGARVTDAIGPANAALVGLGDSSGLVGQLTDPVVNQINRHLAEHGPFTGNELVTVLAGGNDVFMNLAQFAASVGAGQDATTAGGAAVTAMGTAGAQLAGYINTLIVGNGARRVVVLTLPDVSQTPLGYSQPAEIQALIHTMVTTFNSQLQAGLANTSGVLVVDLYTQNRLQVASPVQYGVTNATTPACDLQLLTQTVFASSLVCSTQTLIAGDTSRYAFADTVHPTPYGYRLIAQFVTDQMLKAGWL
jgi:outer membrane lipase/esterase